MSEDEQFALLASDGMLVKRPILITDSAVLVGFKENEWEKAVKELSYKPNVLARGLRQGKLNTIAAVMPMVATKKYPLSLM